MINLLSLYKKALLGRVALAALLCFSAITSTAQAKVCFLPSGDCNVIPDTTSISSACPIGTSTSCGIGYDAQTTSTNGCYKCVKVCPSGQTSSPCEEGFTAEGTTTAGCHKCVKNNCDGFNLTKLPDSNSGWKNCKSCKTGTTTKYKCESAACPSGSAVNKTCGSGWTVNNVMIEGTSTFAKSGDGICQKCVAKTCEVGGTDVNCNSTCQEKVSTNYKSGDSTCYECKTKTGYTYANGKCEPSETCDIGYANIGKKAEPSCKRNGYSGYAYSLNNGDKCFHCECDPWGGTYDHNNGRDNVYLGVEFNGEYDKYSPVDERYSWNRDLKFSGDTMSGVSISAEAKYVYNTFINNSNSYTSTRDCGKISDVDCYMNIGSGREWSQYSVDVPKTKEFSMTIKHEDVPGYKVVLTYNTIMSNKFWYAYIYVDDELVTDYYVYWNKINSSSYQMPYSEVRYFSDGPYYKGTYNEEASYKGEIEDVRWVIATSQPNNDTSENAYKGDVPYVNEFGIRSPYMKSFKYSSNYYTIHIPFGLCGGREVVLYFSGAVSEQVFPLDSTIWNIRADRSENIEDN